MSDEAGGAGKDPAAKKSTRKDRGASKYIVLRDMADAGMFKLVGMGASVKAAERNVVVTPEDGRVRFLTCCIRRQRTAQAAVTTQWEKVK